MVGYEGPSTNRYREKDQPVAARKHPMVSPITWDLHVKH